MPKVTDLTSATTPLAGTETVYVVQGGASRKATVQNILDKAASAGASLIRLQTAVAAAGQTAIDFTGIPSWVNRVTVAFVGFSTSGTSEILVQAGTSGGVETTGYTSTQVGTSGSTLAHGSSTAGFRVTTPLTAADVSDGTCVLSRVSGNIWVQNSLVTRTTTAMAMGAGDKTLAGVLDRIRITTGNGTDTFDAGSVSISWE